MQQLRLMSNPFISKERRRKLKSQIWNFSRYFSPEGKKFSRKCNCIGLNFEPWVSSLPLSEKKLVELHVGNDLSSGGGGRVSNSCLHQKQTGAMQERVITLRH